jgi:hypothetical protein
VYTFILLRKTCILARLKDKWQRTRDEEKRSGNRRTMDRNNGATEKGTLWQFIGVRGTDKGGWETGDRSHERGYRVQEKGNRDIKQGTEDRGQEARNRDVQLGTADRRQGIEMCDMGQRTRDNEQSCKTGDMTWDDIRQERETGSKDMGDRGNRGKG